LSDVPGNALERAPDGTRQRFDWLTGILITDSNLATLMRGARARVETTAGKWSVQVHATPVGRP
jgi:hypothetical protein